MILNGSPTARYMAPESTTCSSQSPIPLSRIFRAGRSISRPLGSFTYLMLAWIQLWMALARPNRVLSPYFRTICRAVLMISGSFVPSLIRRTIHATVVFRPRSPLIFPIYSIIAAELCASPWNTTRTAPGTLDALSGFYCGFYGVMFPVFPLSLGGGTLHTCCGDIALYCIQGGNHEHPCCGR